MPSSQNIVHSLSAVPAEYPGCAQSEWAKPLPEVQLLKKETCMYASFVHDHEYFGLPVDSIIEMTECTEEQLSECIAVITSEGFGYCTHQISSTHKTRFQLLCDRDIVCVITKSQIQRSVFIATIYNKTVRSSSRDIPGIFFCFCRVSKKTSHTQIHNERSSRGRE